MKNKFLFFSAAAIVFLFLTTGCASSGMLMGSQTTQVQLNNANYKIVANSVSGTAKSRYLVGFTFGFGMNNLTFALVPLDKDRAIYKLAIEDLWKNFETAHGKAEGHTYALVNMRYDNEGLNLGVYVVTKITIVADVVEFTK